MEKTEKTNYKKTEKFALKDHDMNRDSVVDSEIGHEDLDIEEQKTEHINNISIAKIRESFHNSDIDIYLMANPFSGSCEAKAYTKLPMENYRFTLEGDNEIFLRIVNLTIPEKMEESKQYIRNSIDTKFNIDLNDDKPIHLSKYGK